MKGVVIILLVVASLIGGIMTLLRTRNVGMPDKDVLERSKARAKEQAAKDEADEER
jgi:hypothetical protein